MRVLTWVTDMTHYVDARGQPAKLPGRVALLANHFGRIVSAVSRMQPGVVALLQVPCRRRPGRRLCGGMVEGGLNLDNDCVQWGCPACGDHGYIHEWRGTPWDRGVAS